MTFEPWTLNLEPIRIYGTFQMPLKALWFSTRYRISGRPTHSAIPIVDKYISWGPHRQEKILFGRGIWPIRRVEVWWSKRWVEKRTSEGSWEGIWRQNRKWFSSWLSSFCAWSFFFKIHRSSRCGCFSGKQPCLKSFLCLWSLSSGLSSGFWFPDGPVEDAHVEASAWPLKIANPSILICHWHTRTICPILLLWIKYFLSMGMTRSWIDQWNTA